jgi:hypothetical protein
MNGNSAVAVGDGVGTAPLGRNGHGSDATALFERKLKLVADQLSCRQLFVDLEAADTAIETGVWSRVEIDQRLAAAQAEQADAEAMVSLTVDGKNEAERKAQKIRLLRDDPAYQSATAAVRDIERRRAEADAEAEALRRKSRRIERQIEYRIAALRLLGG